MSLARGVSASQARDYYYEKDPIMAPSGKGENSEWFGNLKDDFNFNTTVNDAHFSALLSGLSPITGKIIIKKGVNNERRAGIDLAFSAPKSVSIAALHLGDERIIEAHKAAVKKALEFVQENFIYYRVSDGCGGLIHVKSDNMIAGTFTHSTSRSNDPQLHTHAVILNITKTTNGKFKAISNEEIYKNQTLTNNIYQNELAINIQKLGYSIDNYENKFEIKGVPENAIETFSKRSKEIDELYDEYKSRDMPNTDAEIRDFATLNSRHSKENISAYELKKIWEEEYSKNNIKPVMDYVKEPIDKDFAAEAVNRIHETESAFNKFSLLNSLIIQNRGEKSLDKLDEIINVAIKKGEILEIGTRNSYEFIYSTPEMIKIEADIICAAKNGKNKFESLLVEDKINSYLDNSLTEGQKKFINHALTSDDLINIVQGDAGTGKTYAIKIMNEILKKERPEIKLIGLGFTGKAANEISMAADIETSTIAGFLLSKKKHDNSVIIVDESSMVSSRDMLALIKKAGKNKIIFVGDGKQLKAIGAGKMFKDLQNEDIIQTIKMGEIRRQETEITKKIVKNIKKYQEQKDKKNLESIIKILEENQLITEVKSKSNSIDANTLYLNEKAAEEYLKDTNSLLLTPSRREKDELNITVRNILINKKEISNSKKIKIRENINASGYLASSYIEGDIIIFKGKEYKVSQTDMDKNLLSIKSDNPENGNSKTIIIDPVKNEFAAYRESEKELAIGDKIIFTKNDKLLKVQNGLSGTIKSMDDLGNVRINIENDKEINFNLKNYAHIDYGYAQTLYKAQGQTCDKAIMVHNKNDKLMIESFYVAATRAKKEFKIITADAEQFKNAIKNEDEKMSTRDFISNKNNFILK